MCTAQNTHQWPYNQSIAWIHTTRPQVLTEERTVTMSAGDRLAKYKTKRDFSKSPEPGGDKATFDWADNRPVFVIQKHDASNLHYDFRLEVDGVLVSWAVPRGPSTDPSEKRLAMPTEDHPLDYADFEGIIPEGEYGAGTVMVWDRGSYENIKKDDNSESKSKSIAQQLKDGHVTIKLNGYKLTGGFALIRTGQGKDSRWLLIKMDDDAADARRNPVSTEPNSVKSGRSLDEIQSRAQQGANND